MTKEKLTIRKASNKDMDALLAIELACFGRGPYRNHRFEEAQYRYYLRNPRAVVLLATRADGIAGSLTATVGGGARCGTGRVLSIGVMPHVRSRGIGRKIFRRALEVLRTRGCRRIFLEAASTEEPAIALFASNGFKRKRHLPDYYGEGIDGIRMELTLA